MTGLCDNLSFTYNEYINLLKTQKMQQEILVNK